MRTQPANQASATRPSPPEAKRFMDENNNRYAAAVAAHKAEEAQEMKDLYRSIRTQRQR
jgi:hypothetical protein